MYGSGANLPLPEAGEVLVCNSSTTTEDVSHCCGNVCSIIYMHNVYVNLFVFKSHLLTSEVTASHRQSLSSLIYAVL